MRGFVVVAMQDLRFGFDLQLAQLILETRHGARELTEVEFDRTQLLLQTSARNTDFTGIVEELIEQLRADARHLDVGGGHDRFAAWRQ